jgi:hypothetical protein
MTDRRKLFVALGAGALAAAGLIGYLIWSGYQEEIQTARTTTRNYAAIIEARLDATLRRADAGVQGLTRTVPVAALSRQSASRYGGEINSALKSLLTRFPELETLRIVDAGGEAIYYADESAIPQTNIADRPHFRAVRDSRQAGLLFSEVIVSRITGRPSLFALRALRDEQGVFRGAIIAGISLDYF